MLYTVVYVVPPVGQYPDEVPVLVLTLVLIPAQGHPDSLSLELAGRKVVVVVVSVWASTVVAAVKVVVVVVVSSSVMQDDSERLLLLGLMYGVQS